MPETDPQAPTDETAAAETAADETAPGAGGKKARPDSGTPRVGLQGMLTRDADLAARPGFRSPANAKSKAQKGSKKKR